MSDTIKQISVLQSDGSYVSQPIGADAENVEIDATHTLADKASSWDSKVNSSDLANYIPITSKGAINGVAALNAEGKIPSTQIPDWVQPQVIIDSVPAEGSVNAVSSGGVYSTLGDKVDKENGKGLSTNDYTTAEKTKLTGIEDNAEVNIIESISVDGTPQTITNKNVDITLGNKVDKENGKGLSTNDYTDIEKTKLNGIESGAEVNIIESISVNGTPQTITNKNVDITVSGGGSGGGMTLVSSSDTTVTSIDLSEYSKTNKKILLTCVLEAKQESSMCVSQILDFSLETESPSPVPGGETTYSLWYLLGSFTGFFTLNYLTFYIDCFIGHVENGILTVQEQYYQSDTQGDGVNQNDDSDFQCNILKYRVYEIN